MSKALICLARLELGILVQSSTNDRGSTCHLDLQETNKVQKCTAMSLSIIKRIDDLYHEELTPQRTRPRPRTRNGSLPVFHAHAQHLLILRCGP